MNLKKSIFLFTLLFFAFSSVNSSPKEIEIRTLGFPPFGIDEKGQHSGIYYDFANQIVSNAGYSFNNQVIPYARIVKSLKFGHIDLTIMYRYPELEPFVHYIAPLPSQRLCVISLKGTHFNNLSDLQGKKITYIRGAKLNGFIDNDETIIKHQVRDYTQGLKILAAGRADGIIGALQPIQKAASELEKTDNITLVFDEPLIFDARSPWLQISKKSSLYLDSEKLKESFLELEANNTLNTLTEQYRSKAK